MLEREGSTVAHLHPSKVCISFHHLLILTSLTSVSSLSHSLPCFQLLRTMTCGEIYIQIISPSIDVTALVLFVSYLFPLWWSIPVSECFGITALGFIFILYKHFVETFTLPYSQINNIPFTLSSQNMTNTCSFHVMDWPGEPCHDPLLIPYWCHLLYPLQTA